MCLIDLCEEMQRQAVLAELERIRPDVPCTLCRPGDLCAWHKKTFQQEETK